MLFKNLIRICRPQQWYKNLLVFLPIIFKGSLFNTHLLFLTFLGFISLCLISSSNYILNDIIDIKKDRSHLEKRKRPVASGKLKVWQAATLTIMLFIASIVIANTLDNLFLFSILFLFGFTQAYSLWLKKEIFADVLAIAINFVVRASSGAFIIHAGISPWLILGVFFLSLFLSIGKRYANIKLLGDRIQEYNPTLVNYSKELISNLMTISTTSLILCYSLYSFLSNHNLLFTLPFAIYAIFRYLSLVYSGSAIARDPEKIFKDSRLLIAAGIWTLLVVYFIYFG